MELAMTNTVEVQALCKRYPGFNLNDVNLALPTGFVLGLIGPNGAGKTTLIKLILNTVRKDSGSIRVFGLDTERDGASIRDRIGFVHEVPPFYNNMRAQEFGDLIGRFYTKYSGLSFRALANEFDLPLNRRIHALSRGMKMKLALAIALSHDADLLLLDEPTSGLDPVFRRELLDQMHDLMQNERKSILFSTHITTDLERIADFITLIRDGEIAFTESIETMREKWSLVKGGKDLLSDDAHSLFRVCQTYEYGFTALTDRPSEVRELLGKRAVFERASLGDLVYYLDEEGRQGT